MTQFAEYLLIAEAIPHILQLRVNEAIQNGFLPLGGVAVALAENDQYPNQMYCQAMWKMPDTPFFKESKKTASHPMRATDL